MSPPGRRRAVSTAHLRRRSRAWRAASHPTVISSGGVPGQAVVHYETALTLRPGDADAHNNVAVLLGRPEGAEAHYRQALRLQPDDVKTRMNFAALLARLGRDDDAIAELRTILGLRPNDPEATRALDSITARRRPR